MKISPGKLCYSLSAVGWESPWWARGRRRSAVENIPTTVRRPRCARRNASMDVGSGRPSLNHRGYLSAKCVLRIQVLLLQPTDRAPDTFRWLATWRGFCHYPGTQDGQFLPSTRALRRYCTSYYVLCYPRPSIGTVPISQLIYLVSTSSLDFPGARECSTRMSGFVC